MNLGSAKIRLVVVLILIIKSNLFNKWSLLTAKQTNQLLKKAWRDSKTIVQGFFLITSKSLKPALPILPKYLDITIQHSFMNLLKS
jgi:hypothetical protein